MAYFAELDIENKVLRVVVIDDNDVVENGGDQSDTAAEAVKLTVPLLGNGVKWVQTSLSGSFRKQYAGLGYTYDSIKDIFLSPQPSPSFTLDVNNNWEAPIPMPNTTQMWIWDEDAYQADNTTGWVLVGV